MSGCIGKTGKKTPKQNELGIKVKMDAVGKAAQKYMNARTIVAEAKADLETAASELIKKMKAKKRNTINVEGIIITRKRVQQDALSIKKVKQPN